MLKKAKSEAMKGRKMSDEQKQKLTTLKKQMPWMCAKNKMMWLKADQVFMLHAQGKRAFEVCQELNVHKGTLYTVFHRVKSGWNPLEDPAWLAFKEQHEKDNNGT